VVVKIFPVDLVAVAVARPSDGKLQLSFSSAINKDQGSALNLGQKCHVPALSTLDRQDYLIVNVLSADKLPGRHLVWQFQLSLGKILSFFPID
jgi:hypothetical protein